MKVKVCLGNSSVVKIYIIRPKPGPVAKNATPRPSRLGIEHASAMEYLTHQPTALSCCCCIYFDRRSSEA